MNYEASDTAILKEAGRRIRDIRIRQGLRQEDLAVKSGIGLSSVSKIEKGEPVSIALLLPVLRTLNLLDGLDLLIPESGISPIQMRKLRGKTRQRVRIPDK